jgi:hypothetical protein
MANNNELYNKREFDASFLTDDQIFTIIDEDNMVLYYYIVEFDSNGTQINVYNTHKKTIKRREDKLVAKKLIIVNNAVNNWVKIVDKTYIANNEADEYDVIG